MNDAQDGGRDVWFEARLAWRLDSALFSKEEIAIERTELRRINFIPKEAFPYKTPVLRLLRWVMRRLY